MRGMNILVLTNGEYGDYTFCKVDGQKSRYDFVICADRGMQHARALEILPDLIVGDFDSGSETDLAYFAEKGVKIQRFCPEKDATDTEIAIQKAIQLGAECITVYGGLGSRLDHSLANVHLLYAMIIKGVKGKLMNPNNTVYLVNDQIELDGQEGDLVSLIPFNGNTLGVTTKGLGYPLSDAELKMGSSLGVSNYMTQNKAEVKIKKGVLIVIQACD